MGCAERGRSIFESMLANYPKRIDIWNVYVDQVIRPCWLVCVISNHGHTVCPCLRITHNKSCHHKPYTFVPTARLLRTAALWRYPDLGQSIEVHQPSARIAAELRCACQSSWILCTTQPVAVMSVNRFEAASIRCCCRVHAAWPTATYRRCVFMPHAGDQVG
eukprot:GHUV01037320.1.p1 GENE.GHUV01037320.1~~GHUV01037320.1.p1  ORF type:complete len:162 (+),score=18.56 GHUV01037320.1:96-581(+)